MTTLRPYLAGFASALLTLFLAACETAEHHPIFVVDKTGQPIGGVAINPYPATSLPYGAGSKGNATDDRGRIELYDVAPDSRYKLSKLGYKGRVITFADAGRTVYQLDAAATIPTDSGAKKH